MAVSVDRLEDVPVRRLYGSPPVQLSPKDLYEIGILGKGGRKADAVVTIPGGFDLLQDSLDDLLICFHDGSPPSGHSIQVLAWFAAASLSLFKQVSCVLRIGP